MNRETVTAHSKNLGKDMTIRVYGESGWPIIAFPIQDAMSDCYEQFGMVDAMKDYIESGKAQLFVLDSVDAEGWSDRGGDNTLRVNVIEAFYNYVCEEVVPFVHERNSSDLRPLTMGCSLGATHALIAFLRRPDLFQGVIALSGGYDAQFFFGDWMNTTLYFNSPVHFLPNTPHDHPYIDLYNKREIVLCCGQGAWEEEGLRTEHIVDDAFRALGVNAWCDYWGNDVDHDWPWWQKQIQYFLPYVLDEAEKYHAEEAAKNAPAKPVTAKKPAGTKTTRSSRAKTSTAAKKSAPAAKPATATKAKPKAEPAAKAAPKAAAKKAEPKTAKAATPKKPAAAAKPAATKKASAPKAATKKAAPKTKATEAAKPATKATTTATKPATAPKTAAEKPAAAPNAKPAPKTAPAAKKTTRTRKSTR
ncbi:MAG: alpha/beta hydrolase-fold protein [Olsenella sp.]|jgi:esterase/lipase superfamily enzyme|nr:alpha/beta hydrolase-fold protein [Olsenella sp.]MCH3956249.1 alpha/beta hydrolase-fold protein [Olsenella sp.]MCI2123292.1 alpha/beta hydrolase-fold protein [Olsenella sp.]MCI2126812.1 alpha/beta hydrolase-fold protein [Olsenella sp.]MCI2156079.1 alpha/beta hydrolase-fold protein [Olsenella sp.]